MRWLLWAFSGLMWFLHLQWKNHINSLSIYRVNVSSSSILNKKVNAYLFIKVNVNQGIVLVLILFRKLLHVLQSDTNFPEVLPKSETLQ